MCKCCLKKKLAKEKPSGIKTIAKEKRMQPCINSPSEFEMRDFSQKSLSWRIPISCTNFLNVKVGSAFVNKSITLSHDWILATFIFRCSRCTVWIKTLEICALYSWIWWSISQVEVNMKPSFSSWARLNNVGEFTS